MKNKAILLVGGSGYIGSHLAISLLEKGLQPFIFDRDPIVFLPNSMATKIPMITDDIRNWESHLLQLRPFEFELIIDLAAEKSVYQSYLDPSLYFSNNMIVPCAIAQMAKYFGVPRILYSGTAAVYRQSIAPVTEESVIEPESPYAKSKLLAEHMYRTIASVDPGFSVTALRYFNPVGYSPLVKYRNKKDCDMTFFNVVGSSVVTGRRFKLFGNTHETRDGSPVRDFIHIDDLVAAHEAFIHLELSSGFDVFNVGVGRGLSCLEIVAEFDRYTDGLASALMDVEEPRSGENPCSIANVDKIRRETNFKIHRTLADMIHSELAYQRLKESTFR